MDMGAVGHSPAEQGGQRAVLRGQIKLLVALTQTQAHLPRGKSMGKNNGEMIM